MIVECKCNNCPAQLEFESENAGQVVACPTCGMETTLYVPPVPIVSKPAVPAKQMPQANFRDLLGKYVNQTIGVNCKEPKKYHPAKLVAVSDEFFSIFVADKSITVHYPYHQIVHVIEAKGGVSTPGFWSSKEYPVVVEVMQLIVYSGAVGVGVSIPI